MNTKIYLARGNKNNELNSSAAVKFWNAIHLQLIKQARFCVQEQVENRPYGCLFGQWVQLGIA